MIALESILNRLPWFGAPADKSAAWQAFREVAHKIEMKPASLLTIGELLWLMHIPQYALSEDLISEMRKCLASLEAREAKLS